MTPDRRLQVWQDTTGIQPSQTRSGKLYSALYQSRVPGAGSHVRLSLVCNETPAHTVQRMYLSQVRQAWWDPQNSSSLTRIEHLMLEMLAWLWKIPGAEVLLQPMCLSAFPFKQGKISQKQIKKL